MKTIKGPAIFLAQFLGDELPFDNLAHLAAWADGAWLTKAFRCRADPRLIDLEQAAKSDAYCDDLRRVVDDAGVSITELSTHLQGQLVAVHPAYDTLFDGFAAPHVRGDPAARTRVGDRADEARGGGVAALGLNAHVTFSGALAWPYLYPWPQRPAGSGRGRVRRTRARAGGRFSMRSMKPASTSATSCIRARTCTTA